MIANPASFEFAATVYRFCVNGTSCCAYTSQARLIAEPAAINLKHFMRHRRAVYYEF